MQLLFGIPIMKHRLHRWRRHREHLPGGPAGDGEIRRSSVGDMLDEFEWLSMEGRREQSSLSFFYKIYSGTVSLDKDKKLTSAQNIRRSRASHESQCNRYLGYSEAQKNSFFPRTIPVCGILSLPLWSHPRPMRSLRLLYIDIGSRGVRFSMPLLCFL